MDESHSIVAHQFDDASQQRESALLGMWIFLATEIMFFGGLIAAYTAYRFRYAEGFAAASHHLDWMLGAINTVILFTSSLMMTLAVRSAQVGKRKQIVGFLTLTVLLGAVFLGVKGFEYHEKFAHHLVPGASFAWEGPLAREAQMFFYLYFAMTGVHAVHLFAGIALIPFIAFAAARGRYTSAYYTPLEATGLYWHFVDIIWMFLFPLLYLIGPHV